MLNCFKQASNFLNLPDPNNSKDSDQFRSDIPYHIEKEYIPEDPAEFYKDFGYIEHPRTMEPITELTPYQYKIWNSNAKTTSPSICSSKLCNSDTVC